MRTSSTTLSHNKRKPPRKSSKTSVHICTHTHTYTHTHTHTHAHKQTHIHMNINIYAHAHTNTLTRTHTHNAYAHVHTRTHTERHTHTLIHWTAFITYTPTYFGAGTYASPLHVQRTKAHSTVSGLLDAKNNYAVKLTMTMISVQSTRQSECRYESNTSVLHTGWR